MRNKLIRVITALLKLWYSFAHFKRQAVFLLVMLVIASFLEAFSIGMLLPVLEIIVENRTESNIAVFIGFMFHAYSKKQTLCIVLVLFFVVILLKNIFVYWKNRVHADLSFGLRGYWMELLTEKYIKANYNFIVNSKQGTLINNVLVETEKAQFCLKYLIQFISSALMSFFMLVLLVFVSWKITVVLVIIIGGLSLLSNNIIGGYSRKVGDKKLKYAKLVGNTLTESIAAIKQIKTLTLEERILGEFSKTVKKYVKTISDFRVYSQLPQCLGEVVIVMLLVLSTIYAVVYTHVNIKSLVPLVALFVVVGNRISIQSAILVNSAMQILSNLVSLYRIDELIKGEIEIENIDEGIELGTLQNAIVLKGINFAYEGAMPIFTDLNFTIPKGKFVFLIGGSGSGKSTIIDLLLRMQKPKEGQIKVNGKDLNDYNLRSWRKSIGYVSQDVMLFNKSVIENIRDGKLDASEQEIHDICHKVNAHEFIENLPAGYDTNVGDRGSKLSGGQQQRLVLARSIVRDPDFLIFDEATSALDQKLEEEIIKEIKAESKGKTVLFITHRLSTTVHADLVYKLRDGKITRIS
jgi:ABC-type multidrug transport system fused ATPase/permease subunit